MRTSRKGLNVTEAKAKLKRRAGTLDSSYYAIGFEVKPRKGATLSRRYMTKGITSAREGLRIMREGLKVRRKGMTAHLILALAHRTHSVELALGVSQGNGKVDVIFPNVLL